MYASTATASYVGGLVGQNDKNTGIITNAAASGSVTFTYSGTAAGTSVAIAGGLVGLNSATPATAISNSISSGAVAALYSSNGCGGSACTGNVSGYIGGAVGQNGKGSLISGTVAAGNVTSSLVGGSEDLGGFLGANGTGGSGTVSNSYAVGAVNYTGRIRGSGRRLRRLEQHRRHALVRLRHRLSGGSQWNLPGNGGFQPRHHVGRDVGHEHNRERHHNGTDGRDGGVHDNAPGKLARRVERRHLGHRRRDELSLPAMAGGQRAAGAGRHRDQRLWRHAHRGGGVAGLVNGSALNSLLTGKSATTGANGYYYFLLAPGTISGGGRRPSRT